MVLEQFIIPEHYNYLLKTAEEIQRYDFVLLDSNVISRTDIKSKKYDTFAKLLYVIKSPSELNRHFDVMEELININNWILENIIKQEQVYTIPEVIDEVNCLCQHLTTRYENFNAKIKRNYDPSKNKKFQSRKYNRKQKSKSRIKNKRLEKRKATEDENLTKIFDDQGLDELGTLITTYQAMIDHLKIYTGERIKIPRSTKEASETNYRLVEALRGYEQAHPIKIIGIISYNRNLETILAQDEND